MTDQRPTPYVTPEVREGRLVRVCPACQGEIAEVTNAEGMVSNHFAEHYEAEHPVVVEPERVQRFVVIPGAWPKVNPRTAPKLGKLAVDSVRKAYPTLDEKPVEWELSDRFEDLPQGALAVSAADLCVGMLDKDAGGVSFLQREGDELVPAPPRSTSGGSPSTTSAETS